MKELRFENLYSPEFYLEIPNYDCRIAIMKFLDTRDTMGMAAFSLSYTDTGSTDDEARVFSNIIHIRHAIEDLNNSFDLLLQIPWFFYRIWKDFNSTGTLKNQRLYNRIEIVRGSDRWVYEAEKECKKDKVLLYLHSISSPLETKIEQFYYGFIKNDTKPFTVRSLCNKMKHNRALTFKEMNEPYEFNLTINGQETNLRKAGLGVKTSQNILNKEKEVVGKIKYAYIDDFSIDIEYSNGEVFKYKDCSYNDEQLSIPDVYTECCDYFDALVDLFEDVYGVIYPNINMLPVFQGTNGKPNIRSSNDKIDLNKYFS